MKVFRHFFQQWKCPYCSSELSQYFWSDDFGKTIHASDIRCPECMVLYGPQPLITVDPALVSHIFASEITYTTRLIEEEEVSKYHGIYAWWFYVGREVYLEPEIIHDEKIRIFNETYCSDELVLVYMINNHLGRLYFLVPKNALE